MVTKAILTFISVDSAGLHVIIAHQISAPADKHVLTDIKLLEYCAHVICFLYLVGNRQALTLDAW